MATKQNKKYVYFFGEFTAKDGNARNILGGKGAGLADMKAAGMPVPEGFTVTTDACMRYYDDKQKIAKDVIDGIKSNTSDV